MASPDASPHAASARPQPVERFKPTSGQALGWCGLAIAAFALVYVVWTVHTTTGLRIGLAAIFFGTVTRAGFFARVRAADPLPGYAQVT